MECVAVLRHDVFNSQKQQCLSGADLSRKGSVDEPIQEIVSFINGLSEYFTTSSCSGRIYLFEDGILNQHKRGCHWLYTTHGQPDRDRIQIAIKDSKTNACFKFEPFILHVQCLTVADAQKLQMEAVASGYRNSGISISKKGKIILAIRSTQSLEAPITFDGKCLVQPDYITYLVDVAAEKMEVNLSRIKLFYSRLKLAFSTSQHPGAAPISDGDISQNSHITNTDNAEAAAGEEPS